LIRHKLEDLERVPERLRGLLNGWRPESQGRAAICPHIEATRRPKGRTKRRDEGGEDVSTAQFHRRVRGATAPRHMPTLLRFRQVLARNQLLIRIGETGNVAGLKKDASDSSRREP
jgi:hypothetical protein